MKIDIFFSKLKDRICPFCLKGLVDPHQNDVIIPGSQAYCNNHDNIRFRFNTSSQRKDMTMFNIFGISPKFWAFIYEDGDFHIMNQGFSYPKLGNFSDIQSFDWLMNKINMCLMLK